MGRSKQPSRLLHFRHKQRVAAVLASDGDALPDVGGQVDAVAINLGWRLASHGEEVLAASRRHHPSLGSRARLFASWRLGGGFGLLFDGRIIAAHVWQTRGQEKRASDDDCGKNGDANELLHAVILPTKTRQPQDADPNELE